MRRYRLLPMVGPLLGIALGVGVSVLLPFSALTAQRGWVLWIVNVLIVVGFAELVRSLFEHYLVETRFLRAILVGRSRVEGLWMEKLVEVDGGTYEFGVADIEASGQSITYGGRIYHADGSFAGNFQPLLCHLTNARLDYTYFGLGSNNLAHFGVGYTDFWRRNNYVGMFFETDTNKWYAVIGRRLTPAQVDMLSVSPGSQTIRQLADECFPADSQAGPSALSVAKG